MRYFIPFLILASLFCVPAFAHEPAGIIDSIQASQPLVILQDGGATDQIKVDRAWSGTSCRLSISNTGATPLRVKEIVLFTAARLFPGKTPIYGEGFQMLAQTGGTLAAPQDLGYYPDRSHYKLQEPAGYRVVYNLLHLSPSTGQQYLMGFSSANRFIGKFYLSADTVKVVMDLENLEIAGNASADIEGFFLEEGKNRTVLFDDFAQAIGKHHPRLVSPVPTGWCSWYCFGPEVTARNIYDNLTAIKEKVPHLRYIQIDDGYQTHMGDWLTVGNSFGGGIQDVLQKIKQEGFEPAIWVAPFICDSQSTVFKEHPDWLVKDASGQPLRSDKVGFGGWRLGPWYVLDGTNPAVQQHLHDVFSTMRTEWGCTYFKLDANYWGALPGGQYFRKGATRTEAYREGMKAIIGGAGDGAFILGCNQPMWPSLGLVHGARTSMDISRDWKTISKTGLENLHRSWQNGKLWWNDPDCLVLTGELPENMFMFHAALLTATGGMILSGDDVPKISPARLNILRRMADSTGVAADFNSGQFDYGWIGTGHQKKLVVLNWKNASTTMIIPIDRPCTLINDFTGKTIGRYTGRIVLKDFAGRNGAVYSVTE